MAVAIRMTSYVVSLRANLPESSNCNVQVHLVYTSISTVDDFAPESESNNAGILTRSQTQKLPCIHCVKRSLVGKLLVPIMRLLPPGSRASRNDGEVVLHQCKAWRLSGHRHYIVHRLLFPDQLLSYACISLPSHQPRVRCEVVRLDVVDVGCLLDACGE